MQSDLPTMDEWLAERCGIYTEWLDEGRITYSSRVLPIGKSLPDQQWVLYRPLSASPPDNRMQRSRSVDSRFPRHDLI
jgi:hypothetical protein